MEQTTSTVGLLGSTTPVAITGHTGAARARRADMLSCAVPARAASTCASLTFDLAFDLAFGNRLAAVVNSPASAQPGSTSTRRSDR